MARVAAPRQGPAEAMPTHDARSQLAEKHRATSKNDKTEIIAQWISLPERC
jgi:hypothetical protein